MSRWFQGLGFRVWGLGFRGNLRRRKISAMTESVGAGVCASCGIALGKSVLGEQHLRFDWC